MATKLIRQLTQLSGTPDSSDLIAITDLSDSATKRITIDDLFSYVDSDYVQARVTLDGVGLDSAGVTALVDSDYVAARAPSKIEVQSRETTSEYYIYVGNSANKLSQIQDTRGAVSNLVYDQEFATLQEAFNFMMENPLADVGYNDYSEGDKNAAYVIALEQGVTHAATGGYLRLAHVNAQILLLSQNAVDPAGANGSAATIGAGGDYLVLYGMPQLQMGGDIVVAAFAQIGHSNIKWFFNQYNDDVSWNGGLKIYDGSTFYTDGDINSGIRVQDGSYASVRTVNATSLTRVQNNSTLFAGTVTCTGTWEVQDGSFADAGSLTTTGGTLQVRGGSTLRVRNALEINGTARLDVKESSKLITNTVSGTSTATNHKLGYFFEDYTTAEVISKLNGTEGKVFFGKDGSTFQDTSLSNTATGSFEFDGNITATAFTRDSAFIRFDSSDTSDLGAPENPKLLSIGGDGLWDVITDVLNDFRIIADDDIILTAGDDIELTASENIELTSVEDFRITSQDKIILNGEVHIGSGSTLRLQDDSDAVNPAMESFVQNLDSSISTAVPSAAAVKSVTDSLQSQIDASLDSAAVTLLVDSDYVQARVTLDGVGLDSAGVTALVDSDYVAARTPADVGLDSAAVSAVVDETVNDPTTLVLGSNSNAGVGIGSGATTNSLSGGSVSIGTNANSYIQSVAIGSSAVASGTGSVSVGPNSGGSGNFNVAVGRQAVFSGSNSVALGYSASSGNYGIALGDATSGQRSIAIGALASATSQAAIHINANYNSGVGPSAQGGLVIETSAARLEYSADSDWTFNAAVTAPSFVGDGSLLTGISSGVDSATITSIIDSDYVLLHGLQNIADSDDGIVVYNSLKVGDLVISSQDTASGNVVFRSDSDTNVGIGVSVDSDISSQLEVKGTGITTTHLETTQTVIFNNLPTADPSVAGQLWNDSGTLKISAG